MKEPFEALETLSLFPLFKTREEYTNATGAEAPTWNSATKPKFWQDPNPEPLFRFADGTEYTQYVSVVFEPFKIGKDNLPVVEKLVISVEEAKKVNIPPSGQTNVPGADKPPVPFPLKPLGPQQMLVFRWGGVPAVRNLDVPLEEGGGGGDANLNEILTLVQRIAAKLGA